MLVYCMYTVLSDAIIYSGNCTTLAIIDLVIQHLFTNIPTDLAISVARRRLMTDDTLTDRTNLTIDSLVSLLEFCLNATFLTFRDTHYQQTFGTAMGSPVSVTIANLVTGSFHL